MLVIKNTVLLYDINSMKKLITLKASTQMASFLSQSNCIVYVDTM